MDDKIKRIVCFGDSLTKGESWDEGWPKSLIVEGSYPNVLKRLLSNVDVINKGIEKNTSKQALARFEADVAGAKPDIVIVLLGSNDANLNWMRFAVENFTNPTPRVSLDDYKANLVKILTKIRDIGATAILSNLPPVVPEKFLSNLMRMYGENLKNCVDKNGGFDKIKSWHADYNNAAVKIKDNLKVDFVDVRSVFLSNNNWPSFLSIDGIHPLPSGYKIMAECFSEYINARKLL